MNIILCGFMGCGKSTVGKRLADATGFSFVDMDSYIERDARMSITAIFENEGEDSFRQREHDACVTLGKQDHLVIATGGGAVMRGDNVDALKQNGTLVWLRVSPATVIRRLQNDTTRPLLQREDKETAVTTLMNARQPLYARAADVTVDADDAADPVADAILRAVSLP